MGSGRLPAGVGQTKRQGYLTVVFHVKQTEPFGTVEFHVKHRPDQHDIRKLLYSLYLVPYIRRVQTIS